jgi:DHA1 family multidrug resistance protein-like MFS transporter
MLFTSVYVALIYGIYYSFFEVFPIVYGPGGYGMNLGQIGLVFLCILVAVLIAIPFYWLYLYWISNPEIMNKGLPPPERRLIPAMHTLTLAPIGLFIFAWTGNRPDRLPWIAPTIGISVFTIGIFLRVQCLSFTSH